MLSTSSSLCRADGSVLAARRLATDVTFNIMNAPVIGSPVMDELRRQAKEQCFDRRALLGYSSYDSDDDSDNSGYAPRLVTCGSSDEETQQNAKGA